MAVAINQEMELVKDFEEGTVTRIPQSETEGNSWRKRGKADGEIDWGMPGRNIYNFVCSLAKPYIGAHFIYEAKEYKVWKVEEIVTQDMQNLSVLPILNESQQWRYYQKQSRDFRKKNFSLIFL